MIKSNMSTKIQPPKILAIDTSCDETSASVVFGLEVLSNVLPSQMEYHKEYGGVVPGLARFAHEKRIDEVVQKALKVAKTKIDQIDFIAVTVGPGLAIALEVGIKKAISLSEANEIPLMLINHMEGHLFSGLAQEKLKKEKENSIISNYNRTLLNLKNKFPAIGFLVSGGHTELILVKDFGEYEKIGETLDDSAGEAFDKSGRLLGLGYPAGPVISNLAEEHRENTEVELVKKSNGLDIKVTNKITRDEYKLPIALAHSGDLNFSFSGLKTAMKYMINDILGREVTLEEQLDQNIKDLSEQRIKDLCITFEAAALTQLTRKLKKAIEKYGPKILFLGGGVVASDRFKNLVRNICEDQDIELIYPKDKDLTTDNAAMIGIGASVNVYRLGGVGEIKKNLKDIEFRKTNKLFINNYEEIDRMPNLSL